MSQLGDNIAKLRKKAQMTQAELGEKLNISPQAVSKWEKGLSEPDTETLRNICFLYGVSMDALIGTEPTDKRNVTVKTVAEEETAASVAEKAPTIIVGYCSKCKKPLHSPSEYEIIKDEEGMAGLPICHNCAKKEKYQSTCAETIEEKESLKKGMIWGTIAGIAALIIIVAVSIYFEQYVIAAVGGILGGYMFFAMVSQAFWGDFVEDCLDFFTRSFQMPGLIFELDLDGIIWFITVKLGLLILSGILSVLCFILGVVITGICSFFSFPFAIVIEKKKIKDLENSCLKLSAE